MWRLWQAAIAGCLAVLPSCGGSSPTGPAPQPVARIAFTAQTLDLGEDLRASTTLRNVGDLAVGPITLASSQLQLGGASVPGTSVEVSPTEVPTLNPGASAQISLTIRADVELQPGSYAARLDAIVGGRTEAAVNLGFEVAAADADISSLEIVTPLTSARQGEVIVLRAEAKDGSGQVVDGAQIAWEVGPPGSGLITADGRFVGYDPGALQVTARMGGQRATVTIEISPRDAEQGSFAIVGHGEQQARFNSDLWVHGDCAFTGTWGDRGGALGNTLNTWDITDPTAPELVSDLTVDARVVNDVKVRAEGDLAVISHEFSLDQRNGVTLLDLSDPCRPTVISRFTDGLQSGVHNVWIDGDHVYVVTDNVGSGLRVLDVSDPANPVVVASFADPSSFLHDVYVRDGLAFLSHWDSGLIILDVGNGVMGGTPDAPREVSRVRTSGGQTHNAWYWPERGLVFVGEEDFVSPGIMHVVDVSDLSAPVEVATFRVPGDTPHNFWLDEDGELLYMAWYTKGIIALDVSGDLLGELDRQGRTVAGAAYSGFGACPGGVGGTCTWAPQLDDGHLYLSDMNTGLWVLRPEF